MGIEGSIFECEVLGSGLPSKVFRCLLVKEHRKCGDKEVEEAAERGLLYAIASVSVLH